MGHEMPQRDRPGRRPQYLIDLRFALHRSPPMNFLKWSIFLPAVTCRKHDDTRRSTGRDLVITPHAGRLNGEFAQYLRWIAPLLPVTLLPINDILGLDLESIW